MRSKGDRKWVLPLHRWSTSSVVVWPMIEKPFLDTPYVYFDVDRTVATPKLVAALSLVDWEGVFFERRPPLWQRQNAGAAAATLPSAARRVQASAEAVLLLSVAAMCGCWKPARALVAALAQRRGFASPPGGSFLEACLAVVKGVVLCDGHTAMACLRHRLARCDSAHNSVAKDFRRRLAARDPTQGNGQSTSPCGGEGSHGGEEEHTACARWAADEDSCELRH